MHLNNVQAYSDVLPVFTKLESTAFSNKGKINELKSEMFIDFNERTGGCDKNEKINLLVPIFAVNNS